MDKKIYATQGGQSDASSYTGESYRSLLKIFWPEFVTTLVLYSMPLLLDAYFIGWLKSTQSYGTLCATNRLLHFIIKVGDGLSVATIILSGRSNGSGDLKQVGRTLRNSFFVTSLFGCIIAAVLYLGAPLIYSWCVPQELVPLGVPFLRLHAISVLCMFLFFAFVGFLRGTKNTQTPMRIFIIGALVFVACDYLFIFGGLGLPSFGLYGSAMASVAQYAVMFIIAFVRVVYGSKYQKYEVNFLQIIKEPIEWRSLVRVSFPIMIDKATMAFSVIWLMKMMRPLGVKGLAVFGVINDMTRFALIPALAFAQIITFLVSNDFGASNWAGIRTNIRKIVVLSLGSVFFVLFFLSFNATAIIQCFDRSSDFTLMAATLFPLLSVLVVFDVLQLVLSGVLRGAADVKIVMFVRLAVFLLYFMPVSYAISCVPMDNVMLKFLLIYGSFYGGHALMTMVYIKRLRSGKWQEIRSEGNV